MILVALLCPLLSTPDAELCTDLICILGALLLYRAIETEVNKGVAFVPCPREERIFVFRIVLPDCYAPTGGLLLPAVVSADG